MYGRRPKSPVLRSPILNHDNPPQTAHKLKERNLKLFPGLHPILQARAAITSRQSWSHSGRLPSSPQTNQSKTCRRIRKPGKISRRTARQRTKFGSSQIQILAQKVELRCGGVQS